MNVEKKILAQGIPFIYAISQVEVDGRPFYVASSENRGGKAFLIDCGTEEMFSLPDGPGGVMNFVRSAGESAMFSIEEFFPVFDSATSKIIKVELHRIGDKIVAEKRILAEEPYVHRISQLQEADGTFLAAGILCHHKERGDDWSSPGCLKIGRYEPDMKQLLLETVYDGIFKHHAMQVVKNADGYDDLYFGGTEGCFRTTRQGMTWLTEKLLDVPTSDIAVFDLDGDGQEEIAIIEGFHGNHVAIFKQIDGAYCRVLDLPVSFGHVLWCGMLLGEPALVTGSRSDKQDLSLYRLRSNRDSILDVVQKTELDSGQAPAQIFVQEESGVIIATNHDVGELVKYSLS